MRQVSIVATRVRTVLTNHWMIERNSSGWTARYRTWLAETMIEVRAESRRRVKSVGDWLRGEVEGEGEGGGGDGGGKMSNKVTCPVELTEMGYQGTAD